MGRQLRIWSTVLLGVAIGQAGFGSALGASLITRPKNELFEAVHQGNAWLVILVAAVCLGLAVRYRRQGGPRWPLVFAASLLAGALAQAALGSFRVVALHLFVGVLFLSAVTTFCSYSWRHRPQVAQGPEEREAA